jgi:F420-0:gamma-glutamyl ligase-like protein
LLSLKAALSTRDGEAPVYAKGVKVHQRKKEKKVFRDVLESLEAMYSKGDVVEANHVDFIRRTADDISKALGNKLHNSRFRIGILQKLVNLHLKYLWTAGFIQEPPHCPIDGIIRDKAKINYDWTTSDSIEEYKQAVVDLKKVANGRSLAVWELDEFRRRDEG